MFCRSIYVAVLQVIRSDSLPWVRSVDPCSQRVRNRRRGIILQHVFNDVRRCHQQQPAVAQITIKKSVRNFLSLLQVLLSLKIKPTPKK